MAEKRNIILFGSMILLTISYWLTASILIGDKPFEIRVLEEEQQELNENLISAQILASQLDRVFTLFQENLALSKADSLADDASLPFLNNLTDVLEELDIKLLGIKPKPRIDKITYFKAPYIVTLECSYDQFGKFLSELERSPRLITIDEFEVKNGIERIRLPKTRTCTIVRNRGIPWININISRRYFYWARFNCKWVRCVA